MARVAKELSALAVARIRAPGKHAVGGVPGLYLDIAPGGSRAWALRLTVAGQRREMGLGGCDDVTLAAARQLAREYRGLAASGIDPVEHRRQERAARQSALAQRRTFGETAQEFIDSHAPSWRNPKHAAQWQSTLDRYAGPIIGGMSVAEVDTEHVLQVLRPIWTTKTVTAKRLQGRIEQILSAATVAGHRTGENPARWRGHLDQLLPAPGKVAKASHHPALPIDDVPDFVAALTQREGMAALALQFLLLTAARSGEVRGATWAEVDMQAAEWVIPAERMKAGREHRVPLSRQAVELLHRMPVFADVPFVFPSARGGQLSDMTLSSVMRRMQLPYVPHGLRSSFRDWAGDRTSTPHDVIEHALAHAVADRTVAAYRRGTAFEKRRELMQLWADYCFSKLGSQ